MDRLRYILTQHYLEHYRHTNPTVDPRRLTPGQRRSWQRAWNRVLERAPAEGPIADIGCGTGFLIGWLVQQQSRPVIGVDLAPSQLEVARQAIPEVEIHCGDGLAFLRANPRRFSVIFCTDVIEHLENDELVDWVHAVHEALVPGGAWCCRTPNAANLFAAYSRDVDLTHVRLFTKTSLLQLATVAGWTDLEVFGERPGSWVGTLRQTLENVVHQLLFWLSGRVAETPFSKNLFAVAWRPDAGAASSAEQQPQDNSA
jgi:2-polyprenyl-3-methyl-5-hydroxy-6-metoxy-1,4-benzoquinol methylase